MRIKNDNLINEQTQNFVSKHFHINTDRLKLILHITKILMHKTKNFIFQITTNTA